MIKAEEGRIRGNLHEPGVYCFFFFFGEFFLPGWYQFRRIKVRIKQSRSKAFGTGIREICSTGQREDYRDELIPSYILPWCPGFLQNYAPRPFLLKLLFVSAFVPFFPVLFSTNSTRRLDNIEMQHPRTFSNLFKIFSRDTRRQKFRRRKV